MNGWHRAADFLDGYAELSRARAADIAMTGDRLTAYKSWLRSCPDPEAHRYAGELKLDRVLRFFSEALRAHGDRQEARDNAPTPPEPTRVSFVESDD